MNFGPKIIQETDPWRWTRYNQMMMKREAVDFTKSINCKRCGRPWGNHLSAYALRQNPNACPFIK